MEALTLCLTSPQVIHLLVNVNEQKLDPWTYYRTGMKSRNIDECFPVMHDFEWLWTQKLTRDISACFYHRDLRYLQQNSYNLQIVFKRLFIKQDSTLYNILNWIWLSNQIAPYIMLFHCNSCLLYKKRISYTINIGSIYISVAWM